MKFRYLCTNGDDCLKKLHYCTPFSANDSHEVLFTCEVESLNIVHNFISCKDGLPLDLFETHSSSLTVQDSPVIEIFEEFDEG